MPTRLTFRHKERPEPACQWCEGTGTQILNNSMLIADGYRRERCGICGGTGHGTYRADADWRRRQREKRERIAAWGGMKPREVA